jgi:hypothetical protein
MKNLSNQTCSSGYVDRKKISRFKLKFLRFQVLKIDEFEKYFKEFKNNYMFYKFFNFDFIFRCVKIKQITQSLFRLELFVFYF